MRFRNYIYTDKDFSYLIIRIRISALLQDFFKILTLLSSCLVLTYSFIPVYYMAYRSLKILSQFIKIDTRAFKNKFLELKSKSLFTRCYKK